MKRWIVAAVVLLSAAAAGTAENTPSDSAGQADTVKAAAVPELDRMTVTAERIRDAVEDPLLESPALEPAISVVDESDIEAQNAQSVVDALNYVPGAWTESRGRKVKQFLSIRGQKYPYPEYAVDGVWQREFHELPYFFSALQVERIEVLRSSAALINGVSGLTGIINLVPKTYDSLGIDVQASYGSFDTYRANLMHGHTIGPVQYAVGVGGMSTDGPEDKNAAESNGNFYGRARWEPNDALTVQANVFGLYGTRELAKIELPGDTTRHAGTQRFDPHSALVANARTMYRFSDRASLSLLMYYTRRNHDFYASDTADDPASTDLDWEWGANLIGAMSFFDNNVLRISVLYNNWVAPFGKRFYSGKRTAIQTLSAAIADEHAFGPLSVDLGVRWLKEYLDEYAMYNVDGTAIGGRRTALTPIEDEWRKSVFNGTLGLRYQLPVGIGLFAHGAAGVVTPPPGMVDENWDDLENEMQVKADGGARWAIENIATLTATGFYNYRGNGIATTTQWDSVVVDDDTLLLPIYENADMTTAGIELEARSARIADIAQAFVNASFMNHRKNIDGEYEDDTEKPQAIVGGGLNLTMGGFDVNIYGKYVSDYESARFALGGDTIGLGDYSTIDLSAGYTYTLDNGQSIRISVAVNNLSDERYSTVVGYPDYGREFTVGLKYSY